MTLKNATHHEESERGLDQAIRAVMAELAPEEVKNRVIRIALRLRRGRTGVSNAFSRKDDE